MKWFLIPEQQLRGAIGKLRRARRREPAGLEQERASGRGRGGEQAEGGAGGREPPAAGGGGRAPGLGAGPAPGGAQLTPPPARK